MEELNDEPIVGLSGLNSSNLEALTLGEYSLQLLHQWAEFTTLSLKANKVVLKQCLTRDDNGHVICRFCQEGIPNWKHNNSREHASECPINDIGTALLATKQFQFENKLREMTNHVPR